MGGEGGRVHGECGWVGGYGGWVGGDGGQGRVGKMGAWDPHHFLAEMAVDGYTKVAIY